MSDEDRGPSPADGPAKVFGREWTPLAHNPSYLELDIAWMRLTRWDGSWTFGDIASDDGSASSDCSLIEGRLLQLFSAIASLAPSSRLVAALDGETRTALVRELTRECSWENLIAERDEALAQAESLERQFLHLVRCEREANERGDAEKSRAEQAERERDAMHAAAEELRAQGAELGENQWRCESGLVCTFSDATEDGLTLSWSDDVAPKHHKLADVTRHGLKEAAERWHAKNRPLLPDECREQGKPPRKMRDNEVRFPNGQPGEMRMWEEENPRAKQVWVGIHVGGARVKGWSPMTTDLCGPDHPVSNQTQLARIIAFWSRNAPAGHCLTDDGRSVRTMATNEVRNVVTGKGCKMTFVASFNLGHYVTIDSESTETRWSYDRDESVAIPADHPCSLSSNRLRVEAFLAQQSSITDSVQLRTSGENPEKAQGDLGSDGAVLTEADSAESPKDQTLGSVSPSGECPKCNGTGRSCGNGRCDYQWCASCKACNGTGRKTEESDGKNNQASDPETNSEAAVLRAQTGPEPAHRRDDPALPDGEGRGLPRSVHLAEQDTAGKADRGASKDPVRPPGIPASATLWAEVVDGLGRKVGAWFDPDGLDEGHCVRMVNSNHPRDFFTWAPSWDADWHPGGTYRCPSAAAQCRQLYERGMAEQAELKSWAESMAGDESIDTGAKAAAVLTAEATPKPTLTPVDLTELREAWKVWLGSHNSHDWLRFSNALEKLLSSGGAP